MRTLRPSRSVYMFVGVCLKITLPIVSVTENEVVHEKGETTEFTFATLLFYVGVNLT